MPLITISNLNKALGSPPALVLRDVNLEIQRGEFIAIVGQSGSGKSTLLNILGLLDRPTSGSYLINGIETSCLDMDQLAALRRETFGFVFQRYNLLPRLNCLENVALPAVYSGMVRKERYERSAELLHSLELDHKANNLPSELSGGQQQRVSIARALMNGGEIILADEPTGALDTQSGETVIQLLRDLHMHGHTILLVTHNPDIAAFASRVIEICDGKIIRDHATGTIRQVPCCRRREESVVPIPRTVDFFLEAMRMAMQSIYAHKLRSILTMLGIIIGIASVISVIALGTGSQNKIIADIQEIGTNTIEVFAGERIGDTNARRIQTLSVEDVAALERQPFLTGASPKSTAQALAVHGNRSSNVVLNGVNEQYFRIKGMRLASGRYFSRHEVEGLASVAVIDHNTKRTLFPDHTAVGEVLFCNNHPLRVVGVFQEINNPYANTSSLAVYVPHSSMVYKITGSQELNSIIVQVDDAVQTQVAEKNLSDLIAMRHGAKDFHTFNIDSIRRLVEDTTKTMTLLISGVALISLVVGGIGVMNIMLVSVTERTSEIGLRMAIGARRSSILQQFLIESVIICILGGLLGVLLAFLGRPALNLIVGEFPLEYSLGSILLSLGCSSFLGIFFGYLPAQSASRLHPIEALRRD